MLTSLLLCAASLAPGQAPVPAVVPDWTATPATRGTSTPPTPVALPALGAPPGSCLGPPPAWDPPCPAKCPAPAGARKEDEDAGHFFCRLARAYLKEFHKKDDQPESPPAPRRALPSPWDSPPFPN